MNNNVIKLSDIKARPIKRNKTWFDSLDHLYGHSDLPEANIGMPKGKISLWAGESGVGKSRLCIEVAKNFSKYYSNGVVLYIQTEAPLEDFAAWAKDTSQYDKIYCSGVDQIDEIIKIIDKVKPILIFIDSVNEIEEFETGTKQEAKRLIKGVVDKNGNVVKKGLKQATYDVGAHLVLLGQLNQDGKTIKGGTSLPHLVDIALNVVWENKIQGIFRVEVGVKHRYGSREGDALFQHTSDGVVEYKPAPILPPAAYVPVKTPYNTPSMYLGGKYIGHETRVKGGHMQPDGMGDSPFWTEANETYYLQNVKPLLCEYEGWYKRIGNFLGDIMGK